MTGVALWFGFFMFSVWVLPEIVKISQNLGRIADVLEKIEHELKYPVKKPG